ncbi:MAG TPA: hypothetical protein VMF53_10920 [Alphaproteobacteria bacterium]|nr:hypothetical protein [Alphaproteobacteria bacterium]
MSARHDKVRRAGVARGRRFAVRVAAIAAAATILSASAADAQTQLFNLDAGLDPAFCKIPTFRSTVVYVDDMMMRAGESSWAITLADKLRATLTPGERVAVVELNPAQGTSRQIWAGCWPEYTAERRKELAGKNYIFTSNPLEAVKKQQQYFLSDFGIALTDIYDRALKGPAQGAIRASDPARKQIIEALASDGARFAQSPVTIRAIVYSDLAENSDIGSVFASGAPLPDGVGRKLGTYFRHSVFYFFGVGADVTGEPGYLEIARKFWISALASMDGAVDGLGSDLNVPNQIPINAYHYAVTLSRGGQQLYGRASILVDSEGNLVDSWIGISRLTFVGLTGTFQCPPLTGNGCTLSATTQGELTTDNPSETIDLSGTDPNALQGTIGVKGALTFPLTAKLATN